MYHVALLDGTGNMQVVVGLIPAGSPAKKSLAGHEKSESYI